MTAEERALAFAFEGGEYFLNAFNVQNGQLLTNMEKRLKLTADMTEAEQAEALGLVCNPLVETMWTEENIPLPVAVAMDIPFHEELSRILAENLGIDAKNQKWLTSEG